ncbi:hypothetical protein [Sphingomonas soli]|uniref:hypothetical protein n=1 Tax=Sphingomonas soli TaxID=266127 RepID=UPI000831DCEC|nr:hypothetical protein [Sphingomonas soli]
MRRLFSASIALLALASCAEPAVVPQPAPPAPAPTPAPAPAPAPTPSPTPSLSGDWRDWPLTPGTWAYRQDDRGSIALYGQAGAEAELTLRCDKARGRLYLSRRSDAPGALTVRTSTDRKTLNALPTGGTPSYAAVELAPRDPLVDSIGFSRGRFVVQGGGAADLVVPAWPEILRVAEDCR